ncbi:MAG: MBL fold metallo-hydrolase [Planctomycetota bacterium]
MKASLQFLGAARQVTGSKHFLRAPDLSVLLDCGMVQGPRRLANRVNRDLPLSHNEVDAVVLSHAHIDHSGSLPRLVRLGYRGPIHCTEATAALLEILLPDSAHLQQSDALYLRKRGKRFEPAYDMADVDQTLRQIVPWQYDQSFEVGRGVAAHFLDAGHILGSAQVVLDLEDGGETLRIGFTGDLGRKDTPILRDPAPLPPCDVVLTESTYGDRVHPDQDELYREVREFFQHQLGKPGRILIPAFSVGRTQNILWMLSRMLHAGEIEPVPIYVDSPLSNKATKIVARFPELYDATTRAMLDAGENPFFFPGVRCIQDVEESKALNNQRSGIILSASGMCEGGRILHHLEQTLGRPEDCVLIVGFQAEGTLGRKLLEGFDTVKVYGERHRVRCEVHHINGLSAHADHMELLDHLKPQLPGQPQMFVVHGEQNASAHFADHLLDAGFEHVEVPLYRESFDLARP